MAIFWGHLLAGFSYLFDNFNCSFTWRLIILFLLLSGTKSCIEINKKASLKVKEMLSSGMEGIMVAMPSLPYQNYYLNTGASNMSEKVKYYLSENL